MKAFPVGVAALVLALASSAHARDPKKKLDSVVAVVDGHPVLLSYVRARMAPFLARLRAQPSTDDRFAAEEALSQAMLQRIIEESLIAADAERLHLSVSPEEVELAIDYVAKAAKITTAEVLAEAKRQGLDRAAYRADLRRQILEGKWLRKRTPGTFDPATIDRARTDAIAVVRQQLAVEENP